MKAYDRIAFVLQKVGRPVAPHEFSRIEIVAGTGMDARSYIGYSEATIGRRMREMRRLGILTSKTREGKGFKEFALAEAKVAA